MVSRSGILKRKPDRLNKIENRMIIGTISTYSISLGMLGESIHFWIKSGMTHKKGVNLSKQFFSLFERLELEILREIKLPAT